MALASGPFPMPAWPVVTLHCVRRPRYALRFWTRSRGPSPAMRAAMAQMQDHRRRWDAARHDRLRELGSNAVPVRDTVLDLSAGAVRRPGYAGGLR